MKLGQKKFKPEIKQMIENLPDELYQLETKEAKGAKLCAKIKWVLDGKNICSKNFLKVLERQKSAKSSSI